MYAARPARYTPLPRGETAADWRDTFRKDLRKYRAKFVSCNRTRLIEIQEARIQEDYDNWLRAREKFGVDMLLIRSSSSRGIIFKALQVSVLIRVRSSLCSRPRRSTARRRSPRTRWTRSSTRS